MKNKNIVIIMLAILLLVLAVGYAAFSDILTISGTANAKGTFDLEFQNAEVVKNVGVDLEKTTAIISEDKNTLTVNVAYLSYPGSGVEFAVDIVNAGIIPAELQAVTPTNITGSEKIKVTGLDVIKTDHPKIEAGDRCNIHFTVEWPADAGEIIENESSISFGLQIEYTQSTGEAFEGEVYHSDLDKEGNIIRTDRIRKGNLIDIIESQDYGKSINYKATVMNNETKEAQEVSNWKLLYKDENNIYIILDDFLPNNLIQNIPGISKSDTHRVYTDIDVLTLLNAFITTSYWNEFASGIVGAEAQGAPDFEILMKSYNQKYNETINTDSESSDLLRVLDNKDTLYVMSSHNGVSNYWLANISPNNSNGLWCVSYLGKVFNNSHYYRYAGVRPVVKLPLTITGTVGETIQIYGI